MNFSQKQNDLINEIITIFWKTVGTEQVLWSQGERDLMIFFILLFLLLSAKENHTYSMTDMTERQLANDKDDS